MSAICTLVAQGLRLTAVAVGLACVQQGAMASPFLTDKPFDLTVNAGAGSTYNASNDTITGGVGASPLGFSTVDDLFKQAQLSGLTQVNANYTDTSESVIRFGYRGLPLVLTTALNSTAVTLLIPGLNTTVVFNAKATRNGNVDDLKDPESTSAIVGKNIPH